MHYYNCLTYITTTPIFSRNLTSDPKFGKAQIEKLTFQTKSYRNLFSHHRVKICGNADTLSSLSFFFFHKAKSTQKRKYERNENNVVHLRRQRSLKNHL
jgi:hypothetical protein